MLALVVTTTLTWQIVGLADSQVGEAPLAMTPSLTDVSTVATPVLSSPPSTNAASPTTTTHGAMPTTSSTSSSSPTSSSTSSPGETSWSVRTINSTGGTVVVRYRPGEVELQAATPAAGFGVEIDDAGPDRVRVEFESDEEDVRVEVRWENDGLAIEVD